MRKIHVDKIKNAVAKMCVSANIHLPLDVEEAMVQMKGREISPLGVSVLDDLLKNAEIAKNEAVPMCQDTGMAVFFVELGQDVVIEGGGLTEAINAGVKKGYLKGYLRKSVVVDPLRRINTNDNTPAVIHYDIVLGDWLKITFAPKGFGSENMSRSRMLKPSDSKEGIVDFVLETASLAGPNACPPMVIGVGIGGTLDKAAQIAKRALTRSVNMHHDDPYYRDLEETLLSKINQLGIGPQGLGGLTTCLAVNIEVFPTHIAGLPVVVNINCHAARHEQIVL